MPTLRKFCHRLMLALLVNAAYGLVLPFLARLPPLAGRAMAVRLGRVYHYLGLDWRNLWQPEHDVGTHTQLAHGLMFPNLSKRRAAALLGLRFRYAALEDLEGHWLGLPRTALPRSRCDGLPAILDALERDKGIVLLTMHFDASILGIALLGQAGLRLEPMAANVDADTRIPWLVRRYFRRKYAGLDRWLHGGRVSYLPRDLAHLYRSAQSGSGVVVLGDAPDSNLGSSVPIDFFGRRLAFAPGFRRLAEKTGAPLAAFVCLRDSRGGYRFVFSPVFWQTNGQHRENIPHVYAFLESCVRRYPGRWWAADLLTYFHTIPKADNEQAPFV